MISTMLARPYTQVIALLCCLLSATGCKQSDTTPVAHSGVLSAMSWQPETDPPLELNGEWEVVWGRLVSPAAFDAAYQGNVFKIPGRWDHVALAGKELGSYGTATFRLRVQIPTYQGDLALQQISPHAAWRMYVNGELVGGNGSLDQQEFVSHYVSRKMNMSSTAATLVLQVANYSHAYGGPGHAPALWSKDRLDSFLDSMSLYYMFVVGVLFTLSMLHAAIYFSGRQQQQNRTAHLWFSLLCLILVYRVGGVIPIVYLQYGDQALYGNLRPVYASLFLAPTIYLLFFRELFPQQLSRRVSYYLLPLFVIPLVSTLFLSEYGYTWLRDYAIGINVFVVVLMASIAVLAARAREPGALFIVASNCIFLLTALNDASVYTDQNNGVDLTPFGILVLGVGFSLALRQQLQKTLREADAVAGELVQLNMQLEQQVAERTAAFQSATARAENSAKQQARFIAAASHDLRQPLQALVMFTRVLRRSNHDTEIAELVSQQETSISTLSTLLQDTLDAARLEAGLSKPEIYRVDIAEFVQDVVTVYEAKAQAAGIDLDARSVEGAMLTDPSMFRRVLGNLLDNAIKAARGQVLFTCETSSTAVLFRIEDDGPGLEAKDYERVFRPYVTIADNAPDEDGGYGLGLHVVSEFAQQLGSKVDLGRSELGGMRFSIVMALANDTLIHEPIAERDDEHEPQPGLRVLAIDDDPEIRLALQALLSTWACDAQVVANAEQLDHCLRSGFAPQVLLVDFHLAGQNGLELVERLRQQNTCRAPVIFITGATEPKVTQAIIDAGHQVLSKPIAVNKLGLALSDLR